MKKSNLKKCLKCGNCCQKGVEIDLEEAKKLLEDFPKIAFHHLHKDKDFHSGWCVCTAYSSEGCVFLKKDKLCMIHEKREPCYCKDFPYEDGKLSPELKLCTRYSKHFNKKKTFKPAN